MSTTLPTVNTKVAGLVWSRWDKTTPNKDMTSAGIWAMGRPKKSFNCSMAIKTAMPLVKPITTATGMKRISTPMCNTPISSNQKPDIKVASISPSMPCCNTMPYTMTMKAPAGPPICTRLPPRAEMSKPPTMAVIRPASGFKPEAMAKAMDKGKATTLTVNPAPRSLKKRARL